VLGLAIAIMRPDLTLLTEPIAFFDFKSQNKKVFRSDLKLSQRSPNIPKILSAPHETKLQSSYAHDSIEESFRYGSEPQKFE
jgi:hypothetical protein